MNIKYKMTGFLILTLLSSLLVIGSHSVQGMRLENPTQPTRSTQLTVSAAASLKDVMAEIEQIYQKKTS